MVFRHCYKTIGTTSIQLKPNKAKLFLAVPKQEKIVYRCTKRGMAHFMSDWMETPSNANEMLKIFAQSTTAYACWNRLELKKTTRLIPVTVTRDEHLYLTALPYKYYTQVGYACSISRINFATKY